jgi:hypothetical protein
VKSKRAKLNDRPKDTFSGEAGDETSVPKRKENGTAPKRVACQSPADRTAEEINHKTGKEGILPMAGEIFMRVNEVAEELGVSIPYAYKLIRKLNEELRKTGCITIAGRIDRKFFHENFYGTREPKERRESNGSV